MSERLKFVSRRLQGEGMTDLCDEYGISRKTGYKLMDRYDELGPEAFKDQSRAPKCHPNQTPPEVEKAIVSLRGEHPTWGARKISAYLERKGVAVPANSTIHSILHRNRLVKGKKRRRIPKCTGTELSIPDSPNSLWCADFKGQFRVKSGQYCYPLTITDQKSRFLLACEALESTKEDTAIAVFKRAFREFGLPEAIKTDNGIPFASRSLFGLSKLSMLWILHGIKIERIEPGCPQQNGSHERMHRTLKAEATKPPAKTILSQQEQFEAFQYIYNYERPHEAIAMESPANIYLKSARSFEEDLSPLRYPNHDLTARVTNCGKLFLDNKRLKIKLNVGTPFGGHNVGLNKVDDDVWSMSFMHFELGYFDLKTKRLQIPVNPFLDLKH